MNGDLERMLDDWMQGLPVPDDSLAALRSVELPARSRRRARAPLWSSAAATAAVAAAVVVVLWSISVWRTPVAAAPPDPRAFADDPRLARCVNRGPDPLAAFEMAHAADYRRHLPAMGFSPELERPDPAFVVVLADGTTWGVGGTRANGSDDLASPPAETRGPNDHDLCVLVGADAATAEQFVYGNVDTSGLSAELLPTPSEPLLASTAPSPPSADITYPEDMTPPGLQPRCDYQDSPCLAAAREILAAIAANLEAVYDGPGATDTSGNGPAGSLLILWTPAAPITWSAATQGGAVDEGTTMRLVVDLGPLANGEGSAPAYAIVDGSPTRRYEIPPGLAGQLLEALYIRGTTAVSCTGTDLALLGSRTAGGTGTVQVDLQFTDSSQMPCTLAADPPRTVTLLRTDGRPLALSSRVAPDASSSISVLAPSSSETIAYNWSNWCGGDPGSLHLRVVLADGSVLTTPLRVAGFSVPRCDDPASASVLELLWGFGNG